MKSFKVNPNLDLDKQKSKFAKFKISYYFKVLKMRELGA